MKDPYSIIKRPLITEKSMNAAALGKYAFEVDLGANKIEIAEAIETIFNTDKKNKKVEVVKVNTLRVKGKAKYGEVRSNRGSRRTVGRTSDWKKAYVTLKPGQRIDIFEGA